MIWADRVAIAWAILLVLFILLLNGMNPPLSLDALSEWGKMLFILAGIPWLALRMIAGVFSGFQRY